MWDDEGEPVTSKSQGVRPGFVCVRRDLLGTRDAGRKRKGVGSGVASRTYLTSTYIVGGAPQAQSVVSFYLIKIKLKRRERAEEIGA